MNAIHAMEKGVIVLSGSEQIAMEYLDMVECPVINIRPDVKQIENQIVDLINMPPPKFNALKALTLKYVRNNHNNVFIATRFCNEIYSLH